MKQRGILFIALAMVSVCLISGAQQAWASDYIVTDLGTLGGSNTSGDSAYGINNKGQVVGVSASQTERHAFLWDKGIMNDLGTLSGFDQTYIKSTGYAINNNGQVVGYSQYWLDDHPGDVGDSAFIWDKNNGMQPLQGQSAGNPLSDRTAHDINDFNQTVGTTSFGGLYNHAALWNGNDPVQDLGSPYGVSSAEAINNQGIIVGSFGWGVPNDPRPTRAFIWDKNAGMRELSGSIGNGNSSAEDINDSGFVVGGIFISDPTHYYLQAFVWTSANGMRELTAPDGAWSYAAGINNRGQVVGTLSDGVHGNSNRAVTWIDGKMVDLNDLLPIGSNWILSNAYDINDSGQIVGTGLHNGEQRAFLLTPYIEVNIDIKPDHINPKSKGKIQVAILSTNEFNASEMVDIESLTFGRTGEEDSLAFCNRKPKDENKDGLKDLVCHFHTQDAGFQCLDSVGILRGKTVEGTPIDGSDLVKILPCKIE